MPKRKLRPESPELEQNIAKLKRTSAYRDEDNREYVEGLEKALAKLRYQADFLQLDYVKEVAKKLKSVLLDIDLKLREEDDPTKRVVLKADRDSYRWLLKFFAKDMEKEMELINERAIELLDET